MFTVFTMFIHEHREHVNAKIGKMNSHRYILEPYKGMNTRHDCPGCGGRKTFTLYIDTETEEHVGPDVGRCDRESNCGYHYSPKQYFHDHNISFEAMPVKQVLKRKATTKPQLQVKPVSFIPGEAFRQSLRNYETNHFVNYLLSLFDAETVNKLISRYYIGSSKHWPGATVFWQIDISRKLRAGKIMLYNSVTGKRVKEPYNYITWVHKALELPEFNLQQCLFGEHLLKDEPTKPIAIVESEKTAIIASVYLPQFIWLACGSVNNLSLERCMVLKGRTVTLYPDINCFDKWKDKADDLSKLLNVSVSGLLEKKATPQERQNGLDIADYLIRFPIESFSHY